MKNIPKTEKSALRPKAEISGKSKRKGKGPESKSPRAKTTAPSAYLREVRLLTDFANQIRTPLINVLGMNRSLLANEPKCRAARLCRKGPDLGRLSVNRPQ